MPRRVSLPGADELFGSRARGLSRDASGTTRRGPTRPGSDTGSGTGSDTGSPPPDPAPAATADPGAEPSGPNRRSGTGAAEEPGSRSALRKPGPSGRVRHDEKITVYVTAEELLALEHIRLTLRSDHGLAVDRGRLVRAAIDLVIEGVHAGGADSALVRRLREP